ncbi:MAG: LacI family DNA-binding transcriptional regulator [Pseudolabrys sp.]|nr:LacI family DNA-binding transcriptional regulator [Pseudolabrys sp.]
MGGKRRRPTTGSSPTIRDVAKRAGVSPGTVSNVLIGVRGVRADSRISVMKAAEALGYKSNHMASSLRRGHTRTIGVVVPDLSNEFFSGLVTHWEAQAAKAGYEILVVSSGDNPETETRRIQSLIARRVDGLLIVAARDDFGAASGFPALLPPAVLVDRASGHKRFDTVSSDNVAAGYDGTLHLIKLGHRDIVLVTSDDSHLHLRDRVDGYRRALKENGLAKRERLVIGGRSVEACRAAIAQEFRRPVRPTAIFASTFFATLGAIKAIHAFDIALPGEISLVGFEHSEWATVFQPHLTAVAQRREELAAKSWSTLMDRIGSPRAKLRSMKIPVDFSIRDSAQQLAD